MKRVSSRSLLAVAVGTVVWTGCMNPSIDTTETSSEPLVLDRSQTNGAKLGFYFLPPISWSVPAHFGGLFDPDLSPTVRIDQIDPTNGSTIANVATLTGDTRGVRRQPWREFYIARYNTAGLDPASRYRLRVLLDDNELGAVDLAVVKKVSDLKNVDLKHFTPVVLGEILPIMFRIERGGADQDGDGVPDWKDNCPTIYNPPVPVPVVTKPTVPTPAHCNYKVSDCDPQELDCHGHGKLQQPGRLFLPGQRRQLRGPRRLPRRQHVQSLDGRVRNDRGPGRHLLLGRQHAATAPRPARPASAPRVPRQCVPAAGSARSESVTRSTAVRRPPRRREPPAPWTTPRGCAPAASVARSSAPAGSRTATARPPTAANRT